MKNKDLKKGKESIIGKIIYGFLLFMPLLAILSTILYTTFNKNAYQSYYGDTINNKTLESIQIEDIEPYKDYYFSNELIPLNSSVTTNSNYLYISNLQDSSIFTFDESLCKEIRLRFASDNTAYCQFFDENSTLLQSTALNTNRISFEFILESYRFTTSIDYFNFFSLVTYNSLSYLSDSFYYAVDKVEQSNLFNWSKNSIIYTGIHNTCTQLSITTTFVPMLLAYWLIISVIYILYDIILMILIILHNRVHRLQESI